MTMTGPQAAEMAPAAASPRLAAGRDCGSCTMCCKLFRIAELDKEPGQWCRHVAQGRGCGIHETRPNVCRGFFCFWMQNAGLGPEWKPERAKFVLYTEMEGRRLVVATDAASPAAWRKPVYYTQLKQWAARDPARNIQVLVFHGTRATAVLPDRDVDLGSINVGDSVIYHRVGQGIEVEVRRLPVAASGHGDGAALPA